MLRPASATTFLCLGLLLLPLEAQAWDRGPVTTFAVLPAGAAGPEGLEVDAAGNAYVTTFDVAGTGPATGRLYVFNAHGQLVRQVSVAGSTPDLLGLRFQPTTGALLVVDFGGARVLEVDPRTGASAVFMTLPAALPHPGGSGLNDITFDRAGNVYVSDSFQGIIWKTGRQGGEATAWVDDALLRTTGVPPFGANGLRFNRAETALFVANTGNDTVVKIPVAAGAPGTPAVFVNSVNGADGLILDEHDNVWIAANQADEIVVVDPSGRAIAKLGDFDGVTRRGTPRGLLFPASLRFSRGELLVTNLALDLRLVNPDFVTGDSEWAAQVTRYTVSRLPARIPPLPGRSAADRDDDDSAP